MPATVIWSNTLTKATWPMSGRHCSTCFWVAWEGKPPQVKRILELNPNHELVKKLETIFAANKVDPRLELYAKLLLGQAHLADSGVVPDPAAFSRLLTDVMVL